MGTPGEFVEIVRSLPEDFPHKLCGTLNLEIRGKYNHDYTIQPGTGSTYNCATVDDMLT